MFKSAIMEVELDDGGKHDNAKDRRNQKHNIKSNLVELNKFRKQPQRCSGKIDVLINSFSEGKLGKLLSQNP